MRNTLYLLATIMLISSCHNRQKNTIPQNTNSNIHQGVAQEVLQTKQYTYLLLENQQAEQWVAVPKMDAQKGITYYYADGLEMTNFTSKELNKDFPSVLFLEQVTTSPPESVVPEPAVQSPGRITTPQEELNIDHEEGIVPLAELFAHPLTYEGKTIQVKGKVTKFSTAIMNKNWIHLQDGTEYEGNFDLTITSDQTVKTGDIVTLEGTIAVNKDFGYGYAYNVLMENAVVK